MCHICVIKADEELDYLEVNTLRVYSAKET